MNSYDSYRDSPSKITTAGVTRNFSAGTRGGSNGRVTSTIGTAQQKLPKNVLMRIDHGESADYKYLKDLSQNASPDVVLAAARGLRSSRPTQSFSSQFAEANRRAGDLSSLSNMIQGRNELARLVQKENIADKGKIGLRQITAKANLERRHRVLDDTPLGELGDDFDFTGLFG